MKLRALELVTFRAWKTLTVAFDERATVLTGGNGSGKTSILEAAWYCASLGSHRTSTDASLVSQGAQNAIVRVDVEQGGDRAEVSGGRIEKLELEIVTRGRARQQLGGAPVGRRRDVLGTLRASIFAPERQAVVRGDPSDRRRFLDELLVQLHPRYHAVIREYDRALRQRNTLLREHAAGRRVAEALDAWNEAIIGPGAELSAGRARALERVTPHAREAFDSVGGQGAFEVAYVPNVPAPASTVDVGAWVQNMRTKLDERRGDELIRGLSLVGPHRDEVQITLSGMPARSHASHGEGWLAALALVIAGHRTISEAFGDEPVLLLDDPFTLLDPVRRGLFVAAIPAGAQVLVTAADPAEIPDALDAKMVDVLELHGG